MLQRVEKLSSIQIIYIIVICRIITTYASMPAIKTPPANQDMWIAVILSMAYKFLLCAPLLFLGNRFRNMTPIQYSEKILGKYIGKIFGGLFIIFMLFIAVVHLAQFVLFIGSVIIPETPAYAILIFHLGACTYAVYKGIEVIGRAAQIFVPIILFTIILFSLLSINNADFKVFLPILKDSDIVSINLGAFSIAARFSEIIILSMLVPNMKPNDNLVRVFTWSVVIFTIFTLICIVFTQAVLGIEQAKHANYPFYLLTRQINLGDFLQRVEVINFFAWNIGVMLKFSVYIYFASKGMSELMGSKAHKKFIIPLVIIMFILILTTKLSKIVVVNTILSYKVIPYIVFFIIFILPLIILIVFFFRKKALAEY